MADLDGLDESVVSTLKSRKKKKNNALQERKISYLDIQAEEKFLLYHVIMFQVTAK